MRGTKQPAFRNEFEGPGLLHHPRLAHAVNPPLTQNTNAFRHLPGANADGGFGVSLAHSASLSQFSGSSEIMTLGHSKEIASLTAVVRHKSTPNRAASSS